nr:glycosyltransferase family 2 protein [Butyrivibrio sp.]
MISVLVAAYNAAPYIVRFFAAIKEQTFKDFELVIMDDGSTDDTADMVMAYGCGIQGLRLIESSHRGVATCRKELISQAKGDFIIFTDADDIPEADYLEKMHEQIKINNADAVICSYISEYDDISVHAKINIPTGFHDEKDWEEIKKNKLLYDESTGNADNAPTVWNLLAKKALYLEASEYIDDTLMQGEDAVISYGVLLRAKCVAVLEDELYHYV